MAQIPQFNPPNPAAAANNEWATYSQAVAAFATQVTNDINTIDPTLVVEGEPAQYTAGPTTPTQRLVAAGLVTGWLHRIQAQHAQLVADQAAAVAQQTAITAAVNAAVAAALAPGAAPAQPQPQPQIPANVTALLTMVNQLLGQQLNAPPIPPAPAQPRYKAALPSKFTGIITESRGFLNKCENYFVLNPMNDEQRIRFALQLMEGDADHWAATSLDAFQRPQPPNWTLSWVLFKIHFNQRFGDAQEQERAHQLLLNGKLVQTTSVRKYADLVVDTCQKAGWNDPVQWKSVLRNGMKPEVAKLLAPHLALHWNDYLALAISTDEELQRLKGHEHKAAQKKKDAPSNQTSQKKDPNRTDNSKFKLSDVERKEHLDGGLCFKCHQKGHNSTNCKNTRTIYSEVKGKGQVANIETEEPKEEKEDFPKSD